MAQEIRLKNKFTRPNSPEFISNGGTYAARTGNSHGNKKKAPGQPCFDAPAGVSASSLTSTFRQVEEPRDPVVLIIDGLTGRRHWSHR